ncbi:MAG: amino acid ABC transporter ATP-binding protein [Coriobacteriales bacterium]|nr:amino acid ABC transporter ATP-binding protein [Coriobacteriales bacterium]
MTATPILHLADAHKAFGENEVLKGISFDVHKGEIVCVIGASGGGKSTLLRCLTLLDHFDRGELEYDGILVTKKKAVRRQVRDKVGLVFQDFNLFPHFSVLRNITDAPLKVQKRDKAEVMARAEQLLDQMGLSDKAKAVPCELSGGQQQRVSIARALALDPEIIFFDEPTSALDPELTADVLKIMRDLADEHMTMVVVTHEIKFAAEVADRVIFIDKGLIAEQGGPQIIAHPQSARLQTFLRKLEV